MHWNNGYQREALPIIRHFVEVFRESEIVCILSSSCVAMIRDHYPKAALESGDATFVADVDALLPRVYKFSELLVNKLKIVDVGASYPHRVTYHASCHSLRSLHLGDIPYRLLRSVRGLTLVDLRDVEQCCGFGCTFAIKNADVSSAMLADKMACLAEADPKVCTVVHNSCLMHLFVELHCKQMGIRTAHLAEILASTTRVRP